METRATAEASATPPSTWQLCTVASATSTWVWAVGLPHGSTRHDSVHIFETLSSTFLVPNRGGGCLVEKAVKRFLLKCSLLFGFSQQADLALQEAIRIAQESNDHVCLQHCLVRTLLSPKKDKYYVYVAIIFQL